jgi:hypothetical protein
MPSIWRTAAGVFEILIASFAAPHNLTGYVISMMRRF